MAIGGDGQALNLDGDRVASAINAAMRVDTLVILFDVPGLRCHSPDEATLISHIPLTRAQDHLDRYARGH